MKYWFFDLDGTLADTDKDIRGSWKAALVDLKIECPHFDRDFVSGPPIDEMARQLFPEFYSEELAAAIKERFAFHYDHDGYPNTAEYPHILDAVRELKRRGDKVLIVTNKRFVGAMGIAEKFGWIGLFDGIHSGDMDIALGLPGAVKLRKTALLKRVIDELKAPLEDCTMVGDTKSDFEAAEHCGIASIGVKWGYGTAAELQRANRVIESADALTARE